MRDGVHSRQKEQNESKQREQREGGGEGERREREETKWSFSFIIIGHINLSSNILIRPLLLKRIVCPTVPHTPKK